MNRLSKVLIVAALLIPLGMFAQTTSYEVKSGTVVSTFGDQLVVKMANGETKEITVPAGFKFTVDGKEMGLSELQPGMNLTAVIKTSTMPETVKTVKIKNGEVVKVMGNNIWFRENGKVKSYTIPKGFEVTLDGVKTPATSLRPGTKLTAEFVYTSETTVTTRDVKVGGSTPAAAPAAASSDAAPSSMAASDSSSELPKTASPMPLIGLLGSLMTAAGFAIRRPRK